MRTFRFDVTIRAGESVSDSIPISHTQPVLLVVPPNWTPAVVTFQVSPDGGSTWLDWFGPDGVEIAVVVAAGQSVDPSLPDLHGGSHIRLRSGTRDAPVVQTGDRVIGVVTLDRREPTWALAIDEQLEMREGEYF